MLDLNKLESQFSGFKLGHVHANVGYCLRVWECNFKDRFGERNVEQMSNIFLEVFKDALKHE